MLSGQHLTLVALLSLTPGLVCATPSKITWTKGAGTPDFVTPGNWESGNVTLSTLPNDTTSAVSQFSGPADQASDVATAHSAAGLEITADAGNVTLTGNATLTLGESGITDSAATGNQTISAPLEFTGNSSLITSTGSLEISGPVTNGTSQGLHLGGTGNNSKISGAISGTGDLIKDDPGTWKLNAANSYTGKTIVNAGTLRLGAAGALPNGGAITIAPAASSVATLDLNGSSQTSGAVTLGGGTAGGATLNIGAGGALALGGDLTYDATNNPGTANISGGSLDLGPGREFAIGQSSGSSNGDLVISSAITGGKLTKAGAGKLVISGSNTFSGGIAVNGGTLAISSDANLGAAPGSPTYALLALNGGTLEITADTTIDPNRGISLGSSAGGIQTDGTARLSYGGTIDGYAALSKTGTGTLELSGTNSYTGQTQVHAGMLKDVGGHSFAPMSQLAVAPGATVAVNGDETVEGLSDLDAGGGAVALSNGAKLTLAGSGNFSGAVGGNGSLELAANTASEQTLTGTNTYTGGTTVGSGDTLQIGSGAGGVGGTSGAIVSGNITNNGTLAFARSDAIHYGGISGSGQVRQTGAGVLTLDAGNTYTGGTVITGGTVTDSRERALPVGGDVWLSGGSLAIQHNESIGGVGDWRGDGFTPGNVTIASGATLTLSSSGGDFSGNITGAGALVLSDGVTELITGNVTHTGGTTVGPGASLHIGNSGTTGAVAGTIVNNGEVVFDRTDSISYGGLSGSGRLLQLGGGTLTLSGTNTYQGDTEIYSSSLADANGHAFSPHSTIWLYNSTLNVSNDETIGGLDGYGGNATVNLHGALSIGGHGDTFAGSLAGDGSVTIGAGASQTFVGTIAHTGGTTVSAGGVLTIGNGDTATSIAGNINNNGTVTFNPGGNVTYGSVLSGSGSLIVGNSNGILALSGANTYTGTTHVNSSTLRIDATNALPISTAVSLENDGTLDLEANQTVGQLMGDYGYVTLGNGHTLTIAPGGANRPSVFRGSISDGGTGAGALVLNAPGSSLTLTGSSSYSGGTTVNGGSLIVGWNDVLGTGPVTLSSGTALLVGNSDSSDVTLPNAVTVSNGVTLGGGTRDYRLGLGGQVSVTGSAATLHVNDAVTLSGGLKAASGSSAVTFDSTGGGFGRAIMLGAIDPSITSINASNAGIVFGAQAAVPASGLSLGTNNGYIGVGYMGDSTYATPSAASVLNLIGNKSSFAGAIGFDTMTHYGAPHTFSDAIDLSGFGAGTTIGSTTQAVLTGTITPGANGYMFGNGGGLLFVQSALTGGNVTVSSASSVPGNSLVAVFEGNNSFTGGLSVTNSLAVLDSATALPNGRTVTLGNNGYIGFTEAFTPANSLGSFIAHQLAPGGYTATSVLGLDSHQAAVDTLASGHASDTRYVSDTVDLSGLNSVYLGTTTGLNLSGRILAPNQGGANKTLSLLAADGATLTVSSPLTFDAVSNVVVGSPAAYATGTVALLGTSTYAGGTTLRSGTLLLQRSSYKVNGSIFAGPLGSGTLTVNPVGQKEAVLAPSGWLMLDNSIALGGPLRLGVPVTAYSSESSTTAQTAAYSSFSSANLILRGVIGDLGATHGSLDIAGMTEIDGANTFSGGVNLLSTYLALGNDSALGTGTLTISSDNTDGYTNLVSINGERRLLNPIVTTGNGSLELSIEGKFTLNGSLTVNTPTTLIMANNDTLTVNGPVSGPAAITAEYGTILLNPSTPTTASGGFSSDEGVLIFQNPNALPANPVGNAFTANYYGYVGIGFVPGNLQTDFINRFNKDQTEGAIGLDSASVASPNTFNSPITLQGFNDSVRLGSATSAILGSAAVITPQSSTYNFGGGGGLLRVDSVLSDAGDGTPRDLSVESNLSAPMTLRLTGANTFTGGTELYYSGVIFGTNALPGTGSIDGENAYAGTEDPVFAADPTAFARRFSSSGSHMIVGFDSPNATPAAVTGDLSLESINDANTYVGTATRAIISGNITLPTGQSTYHFAGFKGGQLTIATTLTGSAGVVIGDPLNPGTFSDSAAAGATLSRVTLTGVNSYTGSTNLYAGELFVGNANALGTGPLLVGTNNLVEGRHVGLSSTTSGITILNNVALGNAALDVGAGDASFGLGGAITSDSTGALYKVGAGTLTLSGTNTNFAGNVVVQAGDVVFAPASSGSSVGTGALVFDSATAVGATFQDSAVVNGIEDDNGTGTLTLTSGKTFTVNQTQAADFNGTIAGSTAGMTLRGTGQLRLGGNNTYVGSTDIQTGASVAAGSSTAFGNVANVVTLSGGKLVVEPGVTISNALTVNAGKLAGAGTITASGITIGTGVILAPGQTDAVGTLHFANSLTFGSGGMMQLRLADTGATSGGWDEVQVTGNLAITAAAGTPFTLQVVPFTAGGLLTSGLPANFNPFAAGSWMIASANSITGFNANQFVLDTTAFSSSLMGGTFSLAMNASNTGLMLNFTPVPEPSTYALMLAGAGALFFVSRRRKAKSLKA